MPAPRRSEGLKVPQGSTLFSALMGDMVKALSHTEKAKNPLYKRDPIAWAVDVLGMEERTLRWSISPEYKNCTCPHCGGEKHGGPHKWDGTPDPFVAILDGIAANKNVGAESATGTGKTTSGGRILVPWFLSVYEQSLVVTTAPKEQQLQLHLWKELGKVWNKFNVIHPQAELNKLQLRMIPGRDDWTAVGFACGVGAAEQSATRAQGFHAEHMLIITEETPGIHHAVMTAFENTCTGDHNIRCAFGNPDNEHDALHQFCMKQDVEHVIISALDHPNVVTGTEVVPGAVSRRNVEARKANLGEDSIIFKSRVRGICPSESSESLIKLRWCTAAVRLGESEDSEEGSWLKRERQEGPSLGCDVANSKSGDLAALARGTGAILNEVVAFPCDDAGALGRRVYVEMSVLNIPPERVGVDAIGVGASTVNELKRLGQLIRALHGQGAPIVLSGQTEFFGNLRAQMWWQMARDLQAGKVVLPDDNELLNDLIAPHWEVRLGKIYIEEKKDIIARIGRSPNKGDAAVYWNWVRQIRGGSTAGGRLIAL